MALKPCRECGHEVAKSAPTCPNCGVKNPGRSTAPGGIGLLIIPAVIVIIALLMTEEPSVSNTNSARTHSAIPRSNRQELWTHGTVNIRAGRGIGYDVVAQLNRGEGVEVDSLLDGWYRVHRGGRPVGYVAASVLEDQPLPPFEIASWNWHSDRSFGIDGAVIWNVEVRNNTQRYVELVRVNFTTYDAQGTVVDSDYGYVEGLPPGGVRSHKGYATYYGTEKRARISINPP